MARPTRSSPATHLFIKAASKNGLTVSEEEKTVLMAIESGDVLPADIFSKRNDIVKSARIATLRRSLAELEAQ